MRIIKYILVAGVVIIIVGVIAFFVDKESAKSIYADKKIKCGHDPIVISVDHWGQDHWKIGTSYPYKSDTYYCTVSEAKSAGEDTRYLDSDILQYP